MFSVWDSPDKVDTKICICCGTVYLSETLDATHLEGLGKHGGSTVFGNKNNKKLLADGLNLMYRRGEKYFGYIEQYTNMENKKHLDVTCQYGGVVKYFKEQGVESYGIDNAQDLINNGKSLGLELYYGDFLDYTFDEQYDIITMPRVINHYLNPVEYLLKARSLLKPDGIIFIEQLNFSHAIRRKGMYRAINLDHPIMYTFDTLKLNLAQAGLEIIAYSDDLEPNYKFESLNHIHLICKVSSDVKQEFNPQNCLNEILIASNQFSMRDNFSVYK